MDLNRTKQLAGILVEDYSDLYRQLDEVVQLPDDLSIEDLLARLEHCKRALSLCSKLKDPIDKKKWLSATFVNLNKVNGALKRLLTKTEKEMAASSAVPQNAARAQASASSGGLSSGAVAPAAGL